MFQHNVNVSPRVSIFTGYD